MGARSSKFKSLVSLLQRWDLLLTALFLGSALAFPSAELMAQSVTNSPDAPVRLQQEKDKEEKEDKFEQKIIRSKVIKDTYYYVEPKKYSKQQENQWKRECKRKYTVYEEYKACYQKLKTEFLEKVE